MLRVNSYFILLYLGQKRFNCALDHGLEILPEHSVRATGKKHCPGHLSKIEIQINQLDHSAIGI